MNLPSISGLTGAIGVSLLTQPDLIVSYYDSRTTCFDNEI